MVSVKQAIDLIKKNCNPLLKEIVKPISKSGNYILSKDIYSPINMPPFNQSAMDGYALYSHEKLDYKVVKEIKAGTNNDPILKAGDAVRIFTGAPIPDTADTVIPQEEVNLEENGILLKRKIKTNLNIRFKGEEIKKGELALKKDTKLTAAAIGYLTSLGLTEVTVYKKPSIAIVNTGNELIEAGEPLSHGKIYESNSKMLQNAFYNLKFYDITIYNVKDDYDKTYTTLETLTETKDLIIISGGISVGDYDFVGKALNTLQVEELFYKVKQKPGKPLYFGKKKKSVLFALPGNPAAALTCFYMYVYTALQKMMDREVLTLPRIKAVSNSVFKKKEDRSQFLKAIYNEGKVTILEGQSSAMLKTFALSNAFVFLPEDMEDITLNSMVEVVLLPV